jgi:DNA-binding MarR family transcriptional regulator
VWRVSRELAGWQMQYFDQLLGRFGLSTNDSATLVALEPGSTYSMGQVAQLWSCDASTTTWVAKRLEAKRLVTRRAGSDRRVRELTLTPLGEKTRARLIEAIETPPSTLDAWPRADLVQVRDALERFSAAIGLDESRKTDRTRRRTS